MPSIKLDIVTAERVVYSEDVDVVIAPGVEGELGILPHHTPLMTTLQSGELRVRQGGEEFSMAVSGGFLEVRPDRVIVLADSAERVEEIDIERAEEAKKRAEKRLEEKYTPETDSARAEAALRLGIAVVPRIVHRHPVDTDVSTCQPRQHDDQPHNRNHKRSHVLFLLFFDLVGPLFGNDALA